MFKYICIEKKISCKATKNRRNISNRHTHDINVLIHYYTSMESLDLTQIYPVLESFENMLDDGQGIHMV